MAITKTKGIEEKKRYFILDLESHHTPTWIPQASSFLWDLERAEMRVPRALGTGVGSGSPSKHLAVQLREEIGEGRGPARPKGMSCTEEEGERQESY